MYKINKLFVSGVLQGKTISEITNVKFEIGDKIYGGSGGSKYKITFVEKIN